MIALSKTEELSIMILHLDVYYSKSQGWSLLLKINQPG